MYAQVGVNTESPRALLDIKAENEAAGVAGIMITTDGLIIPRLTTLIVGTNATTSGQLIYLTASYTDTAPDPDVVYVSGFYVSDGTSWTTFSQGGTGNGELTEVTEGGRTGYRLADANAANYGNTGNFAVDLSLQKAASATRGATGEGSFAANTDNTASGRSASAFGFQNIISGQSSVGFGDTNQVSGIRSIASGSENDVVGVNVGAIGNDNIITADTSVAFGNANAVESPFSLASGNGNTTSADASVALGSGTFTGGANSMATGNQSSTNGNWAVAMGTSVNAISDNEVALGSFNTNYTEGGGGTDRAFGVGNGTAEASRSDALIVLKDGTVTAPSFDIVEITDDKALITKEYFEANDQTGTAGLERIKEGGNTGYRVTFTNPANFGTIGS